MRKRLVALAVTALAAAAASAAPGTALAAAPAPDAQCGAWQQEGLKLFSSVPTIAGENRGRNGYVHKETLDSELEPAGVELATPDATGGTISVYFHVITSSSGTPGNVSDQMITSQI